MFTSSVHLESINTYTMCYIHRATAFPAEQCFLHILSTEQGQRNWVKEGVSELLTICLQPGKADVVSLTMSTFS